MKLAKRLLKMARPYWGVMAAAVVGLIGAAMMGLVTPEVVRRLTRSLKDPATMTVQVIGVYAAVLAGAYLLRAVFRFMSLYLAHVAAWKFVSDMTMRVYDKLQTLSMRYFGQQQTGEIMSRASNDTRMLELLIAHAVPDLISNIIIIIGVAVMLLIINPPMALLTLIPVPFVLLASWYFSGKIWPLFRRNQKITGELGGRLQDNLSGIKEIQAFGKEEHEHHKLADFCKYYSHANIRANFANAILNPSIEFLTSLGSLIVVTGGGLLAMNGRMPVEDVVGFFMYLSLLYQPLTVFGRLVEDIQSSLAGGERIMEILDMDPEIQDRADAQELTAVQGKVTFDHVSFAYQPDEPVLQDISFIAEPGQMIALVGATGVGKTTIVSLLERFYDPVEGRVLLDDTDIRDVTVSSLRSQLSMVLQDVFLFNGTIFENIAYGVDHATEDEVIAAAKTACAHDFITEMPKGYQTMIGERGVRLSGGQKQRIAIARAVLRNAPVLILDEATSAVDTETEAQIQHAIDNLAGKHTIVVIAHRLSTIMRADTILVLDKGRVVQRGRHDELIAQDGIYQKLCRVQMDKITQP